ncbi:MAG: S-ribosylhomocysteine lyase [Campylobacter lanienae]|nr:S-ribosylhomocysteine lyase [Campylobacter lanienae]
MYSAINLGWVGSEILRFSSKADDIETLNKSALRGEFDASAISFGLYPFIWQDYALLRTAVSFGNGYGPKLIKKKGVNLKPNFKVALSGEYTTNALLFKIAYPNARVIYKNFLDIESAVLSGEVDAGVLIHESILEFSSELCVEREIWDIWCELRGDESLPLPLGGMAIRRSLPLTDAIECERVLTKAVKIAYDNKNLLSKMLLERNLVRVDDKKLEIYLNLYANDSSINMDETQIKSLNRLFEIGFERGFYSALIKTEPNLIPSEYLKSRMS